GEVVHAQHQVGSTRCSGSRGGGCFASSEDLSELELESVQSEIRGRYCVDDGISGCTYGAGPDFISRAENLTTRHGVNGAVAELVRVSNGRPFCSGTLVSRYHLLTAGHCVHGR